MQQLAVFSIFWVLLQGFAVAQPTYPVSVSMSTQNWDKDMSAINETTPEKGLIIQISVVNSHESLPVRITKMTLKFDLLYDGKPYPTTYYPNEIPYVVVPASQSFLWYYSVLPANPPLGNWELKVTYTLAGLEWFDNKGMIPLREPQESGSLEPFPLNFKVVSESQLQQDIQQYKERGTNIIFNIGKINILEISIGGVTLTIIAIAAYLLSRRR